LTRIPGCFEPVWLHWSCTKGWWSCIHVYCWVYAVECTEIDWCLHVISTSAFHLQSSFHGYL